MGHLCGACCIPWWTFSLKGPPQGKGAFVPLAQGKPLPTQWVYNNLHQQHPWYSPKWTLESGLRPGRELGFSMLHCHQNLFFPVLILSPSDPFAALFRHYQPSHPQYKFTGASRHLESAGVLELAGYL